MIAVEPSLARDAVPDYIAARIRQDPPGDSCVVAGSTPIVAFGDVRAARVATLGLNPSRREFLDGQGVELDGRERRFETMTSLDLGTLASAPDEAVAAVFQRCNNYFAGNPYWRWFKYFNEVLAALDVSYADQTACHLDLSQWATDPTWGGLMPAVRDRLVEVDASFLASQLENENIEILLLNGTSVVREFQSLLNAPLKQRAEVVCDRTVSSRIWTGRYGGVQVLGWSPNLQGTLGVTRVFRAKLAICVLQLSHSQ